MLIGSNNSHLQMKTWLPENMQRPTFTAQCGTGSLRLGQKRKIAHTVPEHCVTVALLKATLLLFFIEALYTKCFPVFHLKFVYMTGYQYFVVSLWPACMFMSELAKQKKQKQNSVVICNLLLHNSAMQNICWQTFATQIKCFLIEFKK